MWWLLTSEIIKPLSRRVGTAVGAFLVGLGVAQDVATVIAAGAAALVGVVVDLVRSHTERKKGDK